MRKLPYFYGGKAIPFDRFIERSESTHRNLISRSYHVEDELINRHLILQHKLANCWVGLFLHKMYSFNESKRLVFNAFQSNLFHVHSARSLIRAGLVGSAYPILRLTYEGLIFAKYCSISKDVMVYKRWESGDHRLSLRNDVLNKLCTPPIDRLLALWTSLCQVTHFSTYSGQPGLDIEYTEPGIRLGYAIISMLLLLNYHVLNRHLITSTAEYYVKAYGKPRIFVTTRRNLRILSKDMRANMSKEGVMLVRDFTANWQLK